MSIYQILKQIKNTRGSNAKLTILKLNQTNELLREVFNMAYNRRITYGIKKIPDVSTHECTMTLEQALSVLIEEFATRNVTGNAAINRLTELMSKLSEDDAAVLKSVVSRDLEVGASGSTANKIWKGLIPEQPCMTASSYSEKAIANIKFPAYAQLKADGVRCMIICEKGDVTLWSRNGKQFFIPTIAEAVMEFYKTTNRDFVIDGELVFKKKKESAPMNLMESLMGVAEEESTDKDVENRQTGNGMIAKTQEGGTISAEEMDCIHFQCWDYIDIDAYWGKKKCEFTYADRLRIATATLAAINDSHLEMIETHTVNNIKEARAIYRNYVDMGLEGIILKNINGAWEFKRSKNQVKFKEVIDIDMIVIGWYEHEKEPEMIGGVIVRSKCGLIQNNCGSGFTNKVQEEIDDNVFVDIPLEQLGDMNRKKLYYMRDKLDAGEIVLEMQCNGFLTRKNQKEGEAPYRLFLGVAKKIRFDKDPEQANTFEEIFG